MTMGKAKLVMVGNGMAGCRTLEELLKLAPDLYDITVFGAEPHPNYNRILLSPVLAGEMTLPDIVLNDLAWYQDNHITLHAGKKVATIDRVKRTVIAEDGTEAEYDRLLLATGSMPFMLPVPGKDLPGVIAYRDIADTEAMIEAARHHKHAVVIGAGLLGLEAANGLKLRGMEVTVVHLADWIMERQLDKTAADLLQKSLEAKGLKFLLGKQTAELAQGESGRVAAVQFKDGGTIPADLVVMAIGIRPNTALAEKAGIHCERGIVVNDTLQTFDPKIYAVGECVAHRGVAYGLVAPLFEQAKVCANHLAHFGIGRYQGSVTSTKLKVTGIDVFSAGDFMGGKDADEIVLHDPSGGVYKKLVVKDDKLIGAVLYGDTADGGWYFQLLKDKQSVREIRDHLMFGAVGGGGHVGDVGHAGQSKAAAMPDTAEVCGCNGVCKGDIVKAIKTHGLFTLEDVRKHTKASSSCGSCTGLVEQILASTIGGAYQPVDTRDKPVCGCTEYSHGEVRAAIRERKLLTIPEVMKALEWKTPDGCATCRPALNYYLISTWPHEAEDDPQSRFINERAHANIQRDGTYSVVPRMWGGLTTPAELRGHRRCRREVPGADGQDDGRCAHRPARHSEGESARRLGRSGRRRSGLRPRLRQEHPHGEDLRRRRALPLRHAALDGDGRQAGEDAVRHVGATQGQARRVGLPAQLRRGRHQGCRRDRCRFRLRVVCRRQWRHQDRGRAVPVQGEGRRRSPGSVRRLPPALS